MRNQEPRTDQSLCSIQTRYALNICIVRSRVQNHSICDRAQLNGLILVYVWVLHVMYASTVCTTCTYVHM